MRDLNLRNIGFLIFALVVGVGGIFWSFSFLPRKKQGISEFVPVNVNIEGPYAINDVGAYPPYPETDYTEEYRVFYKTLYDFNSDEPEFWNVYVPGQKIHIGAYIFILSKTTKHMDGTEVTVDQCREATVLDIPTTVHFSSNSYNECKRHPHD